MSKRYHYFGVFSPKSNYLNFIVSVAFPDNIDAFDTVRYLIYSKWDVREITFGDMLEYGARYFYNISIGCHLFSIGSLCPIIPHVFFIKLARRYLSQVRYEL